MDIFVISISDADNIKPELMEEFRHKDFKNRKKEKEHCFSYLMLDRILKGVYKIQDREIEFVNKKPYLKTREKFFSISHCAEYVVLAFSDNECGVDIEKIKDRDIESIAERMNLSCENTEDFYKSWTKYEAEYKLGGKPASLMYQEFEGYMICATSSDSQEIFEIFIQNGEQFPNL